ncbi:Entner-Doudoroff aldolase [Xenococcus sp. PCC 7305]|uniref:bifunctional 4-hydroxy-2-oxoglutarate aldolase/2-dehydro-3-deoxy-phosphogluconate aldolase n=1 Tax=Xenococcus sp. PCC 7305 TaxID=102125 RepID=UPI0002AD0AB2|nr:bifunctional 4-hydroxy-2-oxoglutarate aldolase/2-dehydro-3-deoxy-phosphogluconate aldolase [Xenococcus sp. PCC 7305]ELS03957.1 Entner-Doudoroff aldolase [Xenococcus sp. PCC 7305]
MISDRIIEQSSMTIDSWQAVLEVQRAIAVIRSPELTIGLAMAGAVAAGGMKLIEITWNSHRPQELISQLRVSLPHCLIGAGTILNPTQLQDAIACGAQFLFSPHCDPDLIKNAIAQNIPFIPGAFSPTEIVQAWQAGATAVKVFPIQTLGGANYLKSLQGPLDQIPLIPTGGVTIDNAQSMLASGAIAVGLSSNLFLPSLVKQQNWQAITHRTQNLLATLKN